MHIACFMCMQKLRLRLMCGFVCNVGCLLSAGRMTRKEGRMIGLDGFPMCSVSSCQVSLMGCRVYNQRCYICPAHQRASEVLQGETYMRFCHQCGRLQPLSDFNGNQRSCAVSLHRRRKGMQVCTTSVAVHPHKVLFTAERIPKALSSLSGRNYLDLNG
jgi:hypothetical protein